MENKKYTTKSVVEAGIISGIIVILMLITGYVPFISFAGTLILPIPAALLYIRHDIKITIIAVAASTIITALLFNPLKAVTTAVSFALVGITMGYCIKKEKNSGIIIFLIAIASLIASGITFLITIAVIQKTTIAQFIISFTTQMNDTVKESIAIVKNMYIQMGVTKEQLAQIDTIFKYFDAKLIVNMLGALIIFQAVISAVLNYIVAKAILQRLGYSVKKIIPFSEIYISSLAGALVVLPVPLGVLLKNKNIPIGEPLLVSGQIIMAYTFVIIGVSVAVYFLKNRYKLSKGVIVLIVIFTVFSPLFSNIYMFIGMLDMVFDFRKINPNRILIRR